MVSLATATLLGFSVAAANSGGNAQPPQYPDPHAVHLMARGATATIGIGDISDWPDLVRALQGEAVAPAGEGLFGIEARMLFMELRPSLLADDAKMAVLNELNRLLVDETVPHRFGKSGTRSAETRESAARYQKTRSQEDLEWLNRNLLSDRLPEVARKARPGSDFARITCETCHEGKIRTEGPLSRLIRRPALAGDNAYLAAVRPANPDTFKPMLKRLVCLECHGMDRKVKEVIGPEGRPEEVPIFYGDGQRRSKRTE